MGEVIKGEAMEFAGEDYPGSCHVCLIYDSEEQRRKAVAEYLAVGFEKGELVRYFADDSTPESIRSWLRGMGVGLPESPEDGSFGVFACEGAYCPSGKFDPREMIAGMLPRYESARKAGYKGARYTGEMTWALKGIPGSDRLLEYETLLNSVGGDFPHSGMCQYDARIFEGATLFKVLQVHPYMIARGQLVRNPYFIRPEEMPARE